MKNDLNKIYDLNKKFDLNKIILKFTSDLFYFFYYSLK
jgi:hypothetical protein